MKILSFQIRSHTQPPGGFAARLGVTGATIPNLTLFRILLTLIIAAAAIHGAQAQKIPAERALESLPQHVLDTVPTADPETYIVLYSNSTWSYYHPNAVKFSELPVYARHWDTENIFSYKDIEYADLPPLVELRLVENLKQFKSPIKGKILSKYGIRGRRNHNGVDVPLKIGEPIYAAFDGKVRYAKYNSGGFGYLVIIRHPNGLETWHAHLSRMNVEPGEYVKSGQIIGFGGNTGRSTGAHLHFEMRYQDQSFDPEFIIDFETGQLRYQTFALEKSFFNIRSRASEILEEDDESDYPLIASGIGSDTSSLDILERIAAAQNSNSSPDTNARITQGSAVYHTVAKGDMLGKIAIKHGVTIAQICSLNGITRETTLKIGRKLRVK